jgi:hypothetical protein
MTNPLHFFRRLAIAATLLLGAVNAATAQVQLSLGISVPGVSIGINMPAYPQFVRVPNYPVYYAPSLQANYFFYDGMYWVYQRDEWYMSSWYDGPWYAVAPQAVPLFVLRIPVRYYRSPPNYFFGWRADEPPRWGEHWGNDWSRQRSGWDRWDRRASPAPAPLPAYQRQYSGDRYPRVEQQQQSLQSRNYRYQPRDAVVRQQVQRQVVAPPHPERSAPVAQPQAPERQSRPVAPQRQQSQQQGNERREPQPPNAPGRGVANGNGKGQDKDREGNDEPGSPRRK